jgi:AcrR family transcriptional regulator
VLEAADNLLAESGFAAVTIEGIAARAGVGKQTIYRWWPSKTDIFMDAFVDDATQHLVPPDTGHLSNDLPIHLSNLAEFLTKSDPGAVFRALAGQVQHDSRLASRFRADHLGRQRDIDRVPLQRAVDRGELAADTDIDLAVDQLVGPIYYRVLVTGQPVSREFTDALVNCFLHRSNGRKTRSKS